MSGQVRILKPQAAPIQHNNPLQNSADLDELILHLQLVSSRDNSKDTLQVATDNTDMLRSRPQAQAKFLDTSDKSVLYAGGAFEREPDPKDLPLPSAAFISNLKRLHKSSSSINVSCTSAISASVSASSDATESSLKALDVDASQETETKRSFALVHKYPKKKTQPQQQVKQQRSASEHRSNNVVRAHKWRNTAPSNQR
jgi:hypothetical protein